MRGSSASVFASSAMIFLRSSNNSFSFSARRRPSIRSIGAAPSRVASRLASSVESAGADDESFVSSPDHRAAKIPNDVGTDVVFGALALKMNVEADQPTNPNESVAVDAAISAASRDLDLDEARFPEKSLAQSAAGLALSNRSSPRRGLVCSRRPRRHRPWFR